MRTKTGATVGARMPGRTRTAGKTNGQTKGRTMRTAEVLSTLALTAFLAPAACDTGLSPRKGDAAAFDAALEAGADALPVDAALPDTLFSRDAREEDGRDKDGPDAADGSRDEDGGPKPDASDSTDAGQVDAGDASAAGDAASCTAVVEEHTAAAGTHLDLCSALTFSTNPPSSGNHYPSWPAFKVYDSPVPWGYLVHGLEHGVVVISYNCPDGCAADLAAAKAFVASLPNKAGCDTPSVILTPEPSLDVRFAASAWNDPKAYTLRASCFLRDAFASFYATYADRNYESSCGGGDWSSNGWCPPGTPPPCGPGCS